MARRVIDNNWYLTLGTTGSDHLPRLSPLYFTHVDYRDFYWVSSPTAHHSLNIVDRPKVAMVIFDSTAPVGQAQAVYVSANAAVVADRDLPARCAEAFARTPPGGKEFRPHELSGDAALRLYRAHATAHEVHVPARDRRNDTGVDARFRVSL